MINKGEYFFLLNFGYGIARIFPVRCYLFPLEVYSIEKIGGRSRQNIFWLEFSSSILIGKA